MMAGSALLTLSDALTKWVTQSLPVGQILCLRGAFTIGFILLFVLSRDQLSSLRIYQFRAQTLRATMMIITTFSFIAALSLLPLADTIAIAFTGPLILTLLAGLWLREQIGWRRWSAVAVGFIGVLIMFQPGRQGFEWALLLPLLASFAGAVRDILTRHMGTRESSLATLCYATFIVMLAGLATAVAGWQPLDLSLIGLLALSGLLVGIAHYLLIETFRWAEASLVAPFKYSSLIWAILFGFLIWGHIPEPAVLLGAAVVVVSGLYILQRESRRRQRR